MTIPFISVEISGLATQAYNSGAVNRKFINDVSGAIWTEMAAIEGGLTTDTPEYWTTLTAGTGIAAFEGEIGVSGSTPVSLDVVGYSTISSNAKSAYDWFDASAQKLTASSQIAFYDSEDVDHDATTNFVANEHIDHSAVSITAGDGLAGGGDLTTTRDIAVGAGTGIEVNANDIAVLGYSTISSNAKLGADYVASGNEYSAAYASAQALKAHAFHAKISSAYLAMNAGWASIADNDTIAHGLGALPRTHYVIPSGDIAFAIATKIDATDITVRISAAGNRMVHWRAEL